MSTLYLRRIIDKHLMSVFVKSIYHILRIPKHVCGDLFYVDKHKIILTPSILRCTGT